MRRLVPVAVALLVVGLFWWTRESRPPGPGLEVDAHVRACQERLQAIHDGLRAYVERTGGAPERSGVAFFASLVAEGLWEATPESTGRLTCPGPGSEPVPAGTDYTDLDALGPESSAYAGPDLAARPLPRFPVGGPERMALVACDGAAGMNHPGLLNVLYSDRTVKTFELEKLLDQGLLPAGSTTVPIGPASPLEELRSLVPDP